MNWDRHISSTYSDLSPWGWDKRWHEKVRSHWVTDRSWNGWDEMEQMRCPGENEWGQRRWRMNILPDPLNHILTVHSSGFHWSNFWSLHLADFELDSYSFARWTILHHSRKPSVPDLLKAPSLQAHSKVCPGSPTVVKPLLWTIHFLSFFLLSLACLLSFPQIFIYFPQILRTNHALGIAPDTISNEPKSTVLL